MDLARGDQEPPVRLQAVDGFDFGQEIPHRDREQWPRPGFVSNQSDSAESLLVPHLSLKRSAARGLSREEEGGKNDGACSSHDDYVKHQVVSSHE
jgi:hypothetical protein